MNYSAKRQYSCIIINRTPYVTVDMTTKKRSAGGMPRKGALAQGLAAVVSERAKGYNQ
ncbi:MULTISPECIES: hypothetical protein [Klebsiella]|uniref:Uncharacterized protein n=1 Tax=Klebsiella michiganensis TaxID=1134687 RepID=A0AAJ1NRF3_9ENTR|nr:hypothetical protein [Klebsiella michiganensis]AWF50175.1 hypothetical protein CSC12_1275 [Klebsiella michiganensis]MDH0963285.1 hypothetical protein [Klebsiella michiganensis]MDI3169850.1 hypothetical protein [Klebsiella michiganensis]MDM4122371.1 hypothetical protein [Klebsiella michiganensis]MDM4159464.1 hypothetical protein [Klebsiella michiganensis]